MERLLLLSSLLALAAGFAMKRFELKRTGGNHVNPKRLRGFQIVYSLLLAYPFCALYVWIHAHFDEWFR